MSSPNHHKNPDSDSDMKSGVSMEFKIMQNKILANMKILNLKTFNYSPINNSGPKAKYV